MQRLTIWKIFTLFFAFVAGSFGQEIEVKGENVRVIKYGDGSNAQFERMDNNRTLVKKTFSAEGSRFPTLVTIYRMNDDGQTLGCKIYDGSQKQELFKVAYGYRREDGQLVEERMYDSRVRRTAPGSDREIPVQRVIYMYDANGKRSKPITINILPGKTFREIYGSDTSTIEVNPFDEDAAERLANPNAKRLGN